MLEQSPISLSSPLLKEHVQLEFESTANSTPGDSARSVSAASKSARSGAGVPKRRRACESCRRLKVQCQYVSSHSTTCERCTKLRRECLITPRRRRHMAIKASVTELEKKIDNLNASLQATKVISDALDSPRTVGKLPSVSSFENNKTLASADPLSRFLERPNTNHKVASMTSAENLLLGHPSGPSNVPGLLMQHPLTEPEEIFNSGTLSLEDAYKAFRYFNDSMLCHFPILVLPHGILAAEVWRSTPVLFLAILNAASGNFPISTQLILNQHMQRILAERILFVGSKTIELIQAVQVACIWYYPPGKYESLKYYQLIHCAAVMAIDLGLSRRRQEGQGKASSGLVDATGKPTLIKNQSSLPDPNTPESRRAWLGCYFLASQTGQNLRRECLIRWSPYMNTCIKSLEESPESLLSDRILCHWVRLQHLADDVGVQFSIEDPSMCDGLNDASIRFALLGFESQLRACTASKVVHLEKPKSLRLGETVAKFYMHEVALHAGSRNASDMQPPFTEETLKAIRPTQAESLSAAHISSLSTVLSNIHVTFDTFLSMPVAAVIGLPTFQFVRIIYASVVLIKMAIDTTVQNNEISRMFEVSDFKIDDYLGSLILLLNAAAEGNRCPNAAKFGLVLGVLRTLHQKQVIGTKAPSSSVTGLKAVPAANRRKSASNHLSQSSNLQARYSPESQYHGSANRPAEFLFSDPQTRTGPAQNSMEHPTGLPILDFSSVAEPQQEQQNLQQQPDYSQVFSIDDSMQHSIMSDGFDFQSINFNLDENFPNYFKGTEFLDFITGSQLDMNHFN